MTQYVYVLVLDDHDGYNEVIATRSTALLGRERAQLHADQIRGAHDLEPVQLNWLGTEKLMAREFIGRSYGTCSYRLVATPLDEQ